MREVYILMIDDNGTMTSQDLPIGVAVTTEEEAIKFVNEDKIGYTRSYEKITIFESKDEAIKWKFKKE